MKAIAAFSPNHDAHSRFASPRGPASLCMRHCITRVAQNIKMHHRPTLDHPSSRLRAQSDQRN